ncbi:MAG: STAS domain-containing protein [Candidatus Brocadiia bacterium]
MDITIDTQQVAKGIYLLKVRGAVDTYSFDRLKRAITDCFDNNIYRLAVDISEVDILTSAAVGVLIGASSIAQENKGDIILVRPSPDARKLIDLVGLNKLCGISANTNDALKLLECRPA